MKDLNYTVEIEINSPREKVIELFDNSDNLMKWQTGLKRFDHISGIPGEEGAKSRLTYIENGRELEMTETIIKKELPEKFSALYEAKGVKNKISNQIETIIQPLQNLLKIISNNLSNQKNFVLFNRVNKILDYQRKEGDYYWITLDQDDSLDELNWLEARYDQLEIHLEELR